MSTESEESAGHRKYKSNITRNGADCAILFKNNEYDGYPRCVDKKLSCLECPIAKSFEANPRLTGNDIAKLHTKALILIKSQVDKFI